MAETTRSVVEHGQAEQARQDRHNRETQIAETVDRCSRALGRAGNPAWPGGDKYYRFIERACREGVGDRAALVRLLEEHTGRELRTYSGELGTDPEFDFVALERFLDGEPRDFDGTGYDDRKTVIDAFHSLVAIARNAEIVDEELQNRADALGFSVKLGEHLQDWGMDLGDPVRAVTEQAGTLKTLFFGPTGNGKSAGLEREAEDYYRQYFDEGKDFKLIDPVGLRDGENWYYDVPQQQRPLRRIREEMDLPADFASGDEVNIPEIEILVPLTPGLADQRLPYHVEEERFVVRPYVVPAAELSESLLVSLLVAQVSDQEQNTIRQAYRDVANSQTDWSLNDIAMAIEYRDELQPKTKENAIGVLRSLHSLGFIRTNESEYTVDWTELFYDTGTITVFSQAFLDDDISRLIAVAHVVDVVLNEREQLYGAPEAVLLMRELWKISPHKGRQKDDEVEASIQETIASRLTTLQRENRHYGVHFLGDTQWPSDLHISVRKNFNRYVAYGGNRDIITKVFNWTTNTRVDSFYGTMSPEQGVAGIVGQVQPAIDEKDIEYLSPVRYAPPSHHHKDKDADDNGWRAREKYFSPVTECQNEACGSEDLYRPDSRPYVICRDCYFFMEDLSLGRTEELRRPTNVDGVDWPDEVATPLHMGVMTGSPEPDDELDPNVSPVRYFVEQFLQPSSDFVYKADVQAAFNAFLESHEKEPWDFDDRGKQTRFGKRASEAAEWPLESGTREGGRVYLDTELTPEGQEYLEAAREAGNQGGDGE